MKELGKIAILSTGACVVVGTTWLLWRRRSNRAPGPPGYPLIGHVPYFLKPDYFNQLTKWADEYGAVYRVNIPRTTYIVSDAQLVSIVTGSKGPAMYHKNDDLYGLFSELSFGERSVFTDTEDGELWHVWRKAMAVRFSTENIKASFPNSRGHAQRLASIWQTLQAQNPGQSIDIEPWVQRCFLDIIGHDYAKDFNALGSQHCEMFDVVQDVLVEASRRVANPLRRLAHRLLPFTPEARKARRDVKRFQELFWQLLVECKARGPPHPNDNRLWASLMRVRNPHTNEPYRDTIVAGNLVLGLVAGFHTTSYTVMWMLYDVARHPEMQKRIAQELAQAGLLQVDGKPAPRQLEWADLNASTPYFNAVLKESMRLAPVAATGTIRDAPSDVNLGGVQLRKGDTIWIPFIAVHASRHNFAEPTVFDPERWLKPQGMPCQQQQQLPQKQEQQQKRSCPLSVPGSHPTPTGNAAALSKSFIPFSDGSRNCVGMNFANASMRAVLLTLLSQFWFDLDSSIANHQDVLNAQSLSLVLRSSIPIKLHMRPHSAIELQ